ncbi:MAG: D-alanyl-D-alanine carboxypeptidase [Clostridiales bacterium]|nr:D-alanyl-D-alanine carboxypeptidase [Clostridiales bacterium]
MKKSFCLLFSFFFLICFLLGPLTIAAAADTISGQETVSSSFQLTDTGTFTGAASIQNPYSSSNLLMDTDTSGNTVIEPETSAPSVLLMDADTGTILYAKDETTERPLASVTKVMTLLLIFEAINDGQISLSDTVTVSEHAASMGGSQVYLEAGETQTVETMIKCISVASANDASVAMSEYISGSEAAFVANMNDRAAELGMEHTHFVNACGLDADGHYSCALDIALMSRELTINHPDIFDYTSIWMEDIIHHTAKGDSTFTLSSTNKLLQQYEYATGLKTGSTSKAKFCLAATATRDDINLIAAIMAAEDSATRISDAISLFNWDFANCTIYTDDNTDKLEDIPVVGGVSDSAAVEYSGSFRYLDTTGSAETLEKTLSLPESLDAPVREGDVVGKAIYTLDETEVGEVEIVTTENVDKMKFTDAVRKIFYKMFLRDIEDNWKTTFSIKLQQVI